MEFVSIGRFINLDFIERSQEPGLGIPLPHKNIVAVIWLLRVNEFEAFALVNYLEKQFLSIKEVAIFHD